MGRSAQYVSIKQKYTAIAIKFHIRETILKSVEINNISGLMCNTSGCSLCMV